jgi:hypothetical protein
MGINQKKWPFWVLQGLWGVETRFVAWVWFWIYLFVTIIFLSLVSVNQYFGFGAFLFFASTVHCYLCVNWIDRNDAW